MNLMNYVLNFQEEIHILKYVLPGDRFVLFVPVVGAVLVTMIVRYTIIITKYLVRVGETLLFLLC